MKVVGWAECLKVRSSRARESESRDIAVGGRERASAMYNM